MASDINVVVINGRLTRDVEIKSTQGGTSVGRFSIAVNRRKKSGDTWTDETSYFDVVLWGKMVDGIKTYLTKGRQVSIHGELRQNRWDQDGQTRSKVEIVAETVQLFRGANDTQGQTAQSRPQTQQTAPIQQEFERAFTGGPEDFEDSDIPF